MPHHHHHFKEHKSDSQRRDKSKDASSLQVLHAQIGTLTGAAPQAHVVPQTGKQAWAALLEGNRRFASGNVREYLLHLSHEISPARRAELGLGQHPFAVLLACADSRVSPELIFDQGLGDLFVVRSAGNVPDNVVLGSLEYGLLHLKAPLLVVLGHSKCGAVTAAIDVVQHQHESAEKTKPEQGNLHIGYIIDQILPVAEEAYGKFGQANALPHAVTANARAVAGRIGHLSSGIRELIAGGKVEVVTAVYDIDSGLVNPV